MSRRVVSKRQVEHVASSATGDVRWRQRRAESTPMPDPQGLGSNMIKAQHLGDLPAYDAPYGDIEAMREGKRLSPGFDALAASIARSGIRKPIHIAVNDPYDYMEYSAPGGGKHPLAVMNGNHRVTAALDNDPSQWVPVRYYRGKNLQMGEGEYFEHGGGANESTMAW